MKYQTYQKESVYTTLWGQLPVSGTVTVKLLKDNDTLEILFSNSCSESSQRDGLYYWSTSNIQVQPTTRTEYVYWMENTDSNKSSPGKIVVGGYVDNLDDRISGIKTETDKIGSLPTVSGINTELTSSHGSGSWVGIGMTESDLHDGLDSYSSKNDYKADISTLETTASGIKERTDSLPDDPADQSLLETEAQKIRNSVLAGRI